MIINLNNKINLVLFIIFLSYQTLVKLSILFQLFINSLLFLTILYAPIIFLTLYNKISLL